jgi:hypothetical protein
MVLSAEFIDRDGKIERSEWSVAAGIRQRLPWHTNLQRVVLLVSAESGGPWLARSEETGPFADGTLWKLAVDDARCPLTVHVVDPVGAGIAGAEAICAGRRWAGDQAGVLELALATAVPSLVVGAPGHAAAELRLPQPMPREWTVVLQRATQVEVEVLGAPARSGLAIHVTAGADGLGPRENLTGAPPADLDEAGRWRASDLPADRLIRLSLCDRYGYELQREDLCLHAGMPAHLQWTLGRTPREVSVVVTDTLERPVPGASVALARLRLWFGNADGITDQRGWATLPGVYAADVSVDVRAPGMVPMRQGIAVGELGRVRLEPARTLWVWVEDRRGARLEGGLDLRFECDGAARGRARAESRHSYRFDAVPRRSGFVICRSPQVNIEVAPDAASVTLVLDR